MLKTAVISTKLSFGKREWIFLVSFSLTTLMTGITTSLQSQGLLTTPQFGNQNQTAIEKFQDVDYSVTFFAYIMSFYKALSFILTPIFGIYMENLGLKRVYMYSLYVTAGTPIFFAILGLIQDYTMFMILSFVIRGFAAAATVGSTTALYMMISLIFPGRNVTVFALMQSMSVLGLSVGPVVGYIIFNFAGFSKSFGTTGLLEIAYAYLIYRILPDLAQRDTLPVTFKELVTAYLKMIVVVPILVFVFATTVVSFGTEYINDTIQQYVAQFNLTPIEAGLLIFMSCILQLVAPGWGLLMDKAWNGEIVTLIGSLVVVLAVTLIGPLSIIPAEPSVALVGVGLALFGLGQGAVVVSSYSKLIDEAEYAGFSNNMVTVTLISTMFVATTSFGGFVGPLVGGFVTNAYGFRRGSIVLFGVYIVLACVILLFTVFNKKPLENPMSETENAEHGSVEGVEIGGLETDSETTRLLSTSIRKKKKAEGNR